MADPTFYTVINSFATDVDSYLQGEVVDGNDPILKKQPHNFAPLKVRAHLGKPSPGQVEQATAAPGEKRDLPPQGKALTTAGMKGR